MSERDPSKSVMRAAREKDPPQRAGGKNLGPIEEK